MAHQLKPKEIEEIKTLRAKGATLKDVMHKFRVSKSTVLRYQKGENEAAPAPPILTPAPIPDMLPIQQLAPPKEITLKDSDEILPITDADLKDVTEELKDQQPAAAQPGAISKSTREAASKLAAESVAMLMDEFFFKGYLKDPLTSDQIKMLKETGTTFYMYYMPENIDSKQMAAYVYLGGILMLIGARQEKLRARLKELEGSLKPKTTPAPQAQDVPASG